MSEFYKSPLFQRSFLAIFCVVAFFSICHTFRYTALQIEQNHLRCIVYRGSKILNDNQLDYWWDFGTLLGLTRERDIIFTEVDADISITEESRDKLMNSSSIRKQLVDADFPVFEDRGESKVRIYEGWGWFMDMNVWKEVSKQDPVWNKQSINAPQGGRRIQMITGRHEPDIYNLPYNWFFPLQSITLESIFSTTCDIDISQHGDSLVNVPAESIEISKYWYGETWNIPRKFDKGKDYSSDKFQHFMWDHFMSVFEFLLAFKLLGRMAFYGLFYHPIRVTLYFIIYSTFMYFCYEVSHKELGNVRLTIFHHLIIILSSLLWLILSCLINVNIGCDLLVLSLMLALGVYAVSALTAFTFEHLLTTLVPHRPYTGLLGNKQYIDVEKDTADEDSDDESPLVVSSMSVSSNNSDQL